MGLPPFQRLLDEHGADVHRYLAGTVGRHSADDCWQDTMLAALRTYPTLRSTANLRGWLFTIARHKAVDHVRRERHVSGGLDVETDVEVGLPAAELPDPALWDAVRSLPEKQRTAVLYRFVADMAYDGIGAAMGTSPAAARQSVKEAVRKLREVPWTR